MRTINTVVFIFINTNLMNCCCKFDCMIEIFSATTLVRCSFIDKTFCWGNKIIFSKCKRYTNPLICLNHNLWSIFTSRPIIRKFLHKNDNRKQHQIIVIVWRQILLLSCRDLKKILGTLGICVVWIIAFFLIKKKEQWKKKTISLSVRYLLQSLITCQFQ